jgi:hypothetical protein
MATDRPDDPEMARRAVAICDRALTVADLQGPWRALRAWWLARPGSSRPALPPTRRGRRPPGPASSGACWPAWGATASRRGPGWSGPPGCGRTTTGPSSPWRTTTRWPVTSTAPWPIMTSPWRCGPTRPGPASTAPCCTGGTGGPGAGPWRTWIGHWSSLPAPASSRPTRGSSGERSARRSAISRGHGPTTRPCSPRIRRTTGPRRPSGSGEAPGRRRILPAGPRRLRRPAGRGPADRAARRGRALLALRLGRAAAAEDDLSLLLVDAPDAPGRAELLTLRAVARLVLRRPADAEADAAEALRLDPGPSAFRAWARPSSPRDASPTAGSSTRPRSPACPSAAGPSPPTSVGHWPAFPPEERRKPRADEEPTRPARSPQRTLGWRAPNC